MRTIIAGSRTISDKALVRKAIADSGFIITEIISGCARGVDSIAIEIADEDPATPIKLYPVDWDRYGSGAGPIRNEKMAKYANALILVWDGKSKGSADMLKRAITYRLKIHSLIVK